MARVLRSFSPASLSPRRRALVVGLTGIAVLAATLAGLASLRAALPRATGDEPYPPQDRPGPVLLVPGYGGAAGALERLAARLRAAGRPATVVRLPGEGTGDLAAQADVLDRAVRDALDDGGPSVDLVGYSAGGVVVRLWLAEHDGERKARRVVTLGSPHHGTRVAGLGAAFTPDACPDACRQLAPGSSLLARLDRAPVPDRPPWLSVWTTRDEVVTPPDSARLDGAVNAALQSVCPDETVDHGGLPTAPLVTGLVLRALGPDPLAAPAAADCAELRAAGSARGVSS